MFVKLIYVSLLHCAPSVGGRGVAEGELILMMSEDSNWDIVNCYDDNVSTSTAISRAVNGTS